ncbi:methyltransferase domain-containing protein [Streptomyces sp. TX20-6-3]|uniref:class I SAM-dependent methyltransferase n=1 Tax=unclassified Streptomyces TaxID=2593676 RepID=UPI0029AD938A|nr:methyltransferase domain-containing protein [Streptomyces sp. TX20-6-3]MDX2561405.1 methyltransferase domain-containing protein [Streptomyces sp. TX20-6-3]
MRTLFQAAHRGLHRLADRRHDHRGHEAEPGGMGISGEAYDRLSGRLLSGLYRRAADDVCRAPEDALVVDIGTGPGRLLLDIARRRPDLRPHGVDVAPSMTERARHNARAHGYGDRITLHTASADALPLADASADVIVSTLSMHHWADVPRAVTEMARVLRPGGRLVIYDFRATSDAPLTRTVAARPEFAGRTVERTLVTGAPWIPFPLFARMTVERAPAPANPSHATAGN